MSDNYESAIKIARELDLANRERQETELDIMREALAMIDADKDFHKKRVIVLAKEGWHNGVIGIVASKLMEKFYRPCILISVTDGVGKGSGRSIPGLNLFNALSSCEDLLTNFGGHAVAAGLGISADKIEELEKRLDKYIKDNTTDEDMIPVVLIDSVINGQSLNMNTVRQLAALEPFGMANESPVFAVKDARVRNVSSVGLDGKHIRMQIEKDGVLVNTIGFGMGEFADIIKTDDKVHIAFKPDINVYQGNESLQLVLTDIKVAE